MFSKKKMNEYTKDYSDNIQRLKQAIHEAEVILIGAGSGLSTAAGLTYTGERFEKYFSDFIEKYGIQDMYSVGFYPFSSLEEYWGWWSRHIYINRYDQEIREPYSILLELVKDKDYFILTTNVDHQFQLTGFDKKRLFYTQGDYGLFQCSKACHDKTYDNEEVIRKMIQEQKDRKIPTSLIPYCPVCGAPMTTNLRCDEFFVEDEGWKKASNRYEQFLRKASNRKMLLLELGVGGNTPGIIKYPFWKMTYHNENITYACINYGEAIVPKEITRQSILIDMDIKKALKDVSV